MAEKKLNTVNPEEWELYDFITSIRFRNSEWQRLVEAAKAEGVSVSSLIRTGAAMVLDLLEEAHAQQGGNPSAG